jgi:GxxExxY protein
MEENEFGSVVVDAAVQVHRELVPGLPEAVYEIALMMEFEDRGPFFRTTALRSD